MVIATVVIVLTFAAGFLTVFGINLVLLDLGEGERKRMKERMNEELRLRAQEQARKFKKQHKDLGALAAEAFEETAAGRNGPKQWFVALVEQSGLNITVGKLMGSMFWSAAGMALFGLAVLRIPAVAAAVGFVGAWIPVVIVHFKRNQRLDLLRSQLPDAFDLMSRVMRAGQSLPQAMNAVGQEFKPPVAMEFSYCYEQQNLGLAPELALRDLARRTGLLEIKIFVLALLVHQQTGGNLTEILENLAAVVRDRFRIRGMIASLTAEGRVQAGILLAMPPLMYFIVLLINREYALRLWEHPTLPIAALAFMMFGAVWIRRIVNFDF